MPGSGTALRPGAAALPVPTMGNLVGASETVLQAPSSAQTTVDGCRGKRLTVLLS